MAARALVPPVRRPQVAARRVPLQRDRAQAGRAAGLLCPDLQRHGTDAATYMDPLCILLLPNLLCYYLLFYLLFYLHIGGRESPALQRCALLYNAAHCADPLPLVGWHSTLTFLARISSVQEYIASKRYIHMDLAARNVLAGADNSCRIADFGLSRRLPPGKDCWRPRQVMKVSPKWAAIECLDERMFSVESDVWATGVTMWEVMSCVRSEPKLNPPSRMFWVRSHSGD